MDKIFGIRLFTDWLYFKQNIYPLILGLAFFFGSFSLGIWIGESNADRRHKEIISYPSHGEGLRSSISLSMSKT